MIKYLNLTNFDSSCNLLGFWAKRKRNSLKSIDYVIWQLNDNNTKLVFRLFSIDNRCGLRICVKVKKQDATRAVETGNVSAMLRTIAKHEKAFITLTKSDANDVKFSYSFFKMPLSRTEISAEKILAIKSSPNKFNNSWQL